MNETKELTVVPPQPMALAAAKLSPLDMLQAMIERGITSENVAAFGEVVKLIEHVEERNAEKAFAQAFVALQADIPVIVAKTVIPNRGKYERFEDLMEVIGPLLTKHGFVVTFSMDFKDNRVLETCHLTHIGGHSRQNSFAVRTGKADSETQSDCKAATTAKRNALCNALNIVIRQDCLSEEGDARMEGGPITPEQAADLHKRVCDTGSDERRFLAFAKSPMGDEPLSSLTSDKIKALYEKIPSAMLSLLDETLRRKEKTT